MLKKIGYIALLLTILLPSGGYLMIYKMQQYLVRIDIDKQLHDNLVPTETLSLSLTDFHKSKIDSREISFKGKLYDIRSVKYLGNMVELAVINDTGEENILYKIRDLVCNTNPRHSHLPDELVKLLTLVYIFPTQHGNDFSVIKQPIGFLPYCEFFISNKLDITSPPPKLV